MKKCAMPLSEPLVDQRPRSEMVKKLTYSGVEGEGVSEKENSEFKPVKLRLKIGLVSYPARAEGLVNR